jgi:hypothetical protein
MGMYNEVFKKCPDCGGCGYMQIAQVTLGFGGFDLDDFYSLERLDEDDLKLLHARVALGRFKCDCCGGLFSLDRALKGSASSREGLLKTLFGMRRA